MFYSYRLILLSISFVIAALNTAVAQQYSASQYSDKIPFDTATLKGVLPNGFQYFLRKNSEPSDRATLYLVSKAGSILENRDERGFAHFVEHMSFNGTKNFPKNTLVDYLQKIGVKFGADLNAYTSFDETVYQLPIPTKDSVIVKNSIKILRDWAQNALLEDDEIEAERGVILEEKRLRKGVGERVQEFTFPILMNHSRYADRLPIGTDSVLNHFKPEALRQFYKKWYRPNLQAIIAVGDFDIQKLEMEIKKAFSNLKNPVHSPERISYSIPLNNKNNFITITDPEIPVTSLELIVKFPGSTLKTIGDLRESMLKAIFNGMLSARLSEAAKQANPPFLKANVGFGNLPADLQAVVINVSTKPAQLERGFKAALSEIERVRQTGFTETELERTKQSFMNGQEYRYAERDKKPSAAYVKEYVQIFLKDRANPSADFLYHFYKNNISGIILSEVNNLINKYDFSFNRDIIITAPESEKQKLPDEENILTWIKKVQDSSLSRYQDQSYDEPLITATPEAGKILKETINKKTGITIWKLNNGVKVILKPTDFKNDQVLIGSYSPGGTSLYDTSDYQSAINAAGIVKASGIGKYDSKVLLKMLSGKLVSVSPYIGERYEGINGQSSVKDLPIAFQLIYLYFTNPRLDDEVIEGILGNAKSTVVNRYNNPGNVFADTINAVLGNYNFRRRPPSLELINQINPERSLEIFKARFADASDFTFVITGSFNIDSIKPLVLEYLASLPDISRIEEGRDLGIEIPRGNIIKTVYRGREQKASVQIVLSGDYEYSEMNNWNMKALQEIMKIRLTERLREKEGGIYTSNVSVSYNKNPRPRYSVSISFGCAPENVEKLIKSTFDELKAITKNGPGKIDLEKYKKEEALSIELALKNNSYWEKNLVYRFQNEEDPDQIPLVLDRVNDITEKSVQEIAAKYLKTDNVAKFILLPEFDETPSK